MTTSHEGKRLGGRYTLRQLLGVGGICAVYEAEHCFTGRRMAVKSLRDEYILHDEARARLLDEARALGMVRHPHVVEVHDAGFSGALPYVAMELLEGCSLEAILASRGALSPHDAAEVARQAALALHAVHHAGLVHRDVKPGNLFLVQAHIGREQVRLIDFGVALVPGVPLAASAGAVGLVGTPEYMAPEQMSRRLDLDARADLYALGASLFECVTGGVPYAGTPESIARQLSRRDPVSVRALAPEVPVGLAAVIEKCLAYDPRDRFSDALSLVSALDATGLTQHTLNLLERSLWGPSNSGIIPAARREEMVREADTRGLDVRSSGVRRVTSWSAEMPAATASDAHQHARAVYNGPVRVESEGGVYSLYAHDLSEGGLLAVGPRVFTPGERVRLEFALPTTASVVTAYALVQWVRDREGAPKMSCAVGFQFADVSPQLRDSVLSYLNSA